MRNIYGTSLTLRGVHGTPAVLFGVVFVAAAQFLFTYAPFMQGVFNMRPLALTDGLAAIGVGVAMLFIVEIKKWVRRHPNRCRGGCS